MFLDILGALLIIGVAYVVVYTVVITIFGVITMRVVTFLFLFWLAMKFLDYCSKIGEKRRAKMWGKVDKKIEQRTGKKTTFFEKLFK